MIARVRVGVLCHAVELDSNYSPDAGKSLHIILSDPLNHKGFK